MKRYSLLQLALILTSLYLILKNKGNLIAVLCLFAAYLFEILNQKSQRKRLKFNSNVTMVATGPTEKTSSSTDILLKNENQQLKQENEELKKENAALKERIKQFTAQTNTEVNSNKEKRIHQRHDLLLPVEVGLNNEFYSCYARDISLRGMKLETTKQFPSGTILTLFFKLPNSDRSFKIEGQVMRCGTGELGIKFNYKDNYVVEEMKRLLNFI